MINQRNNAWLYPGSRWWKFDFHTHTPASLDTHAWQKAIGTPTEVTPETWLMKYMAAGIDCVAVTDHNTGDWIGRLQTAYRHMKEAATCGEAPMGFRELTLFPGVEISVNGGLHLLATFDPSATERQINDLLAVVKYQGTRGDSDGVTQESAAKVVLAVLEAGGIPIPAHADQDKGLLQVKPGSRASVQDAHTIRQIMEIPELLAVEWVDPALPLPTSVEGQARALTRVIGSDCHNFQGLNPPGSRFTWVKMARPSLTGLRLALLDGGDFSIRRSDAGEFDPYHTPVHCITAVEIERARYMGNQQAERLSLSPCCNALIGGRGTGKSTMVHALRLAYQRQTELQRLGETTEPYRQFQSFTTPFRRRDGEGALRDNTEIRVEIMRQGAPFRLRWRQDGAGPAVEERAADGSWRAADNQAVTSERFPVRILSQGQIAAMAGDGRRALLDIIDEAADLGTLHAQCEQAQRTFLRQRAELRELDTQLDARSEVERTLEDVRQKADTLTQSHHAEVLRKHQSALRQQREIETSLEQLGAIPGRLTALAEDLLLDDWPAGVFDASQDEDILRWRQALDDYLVKVRQALNKIGQVVERKTQAFTDDALFNAWRTRVDESRDAYRTLQATLTAQGLEGPQGFERLVQERQGLEDRLREMDRLRTRRDDLAEQNQAQWLRLLELRKGITIARQRFLTATLTTNAFVRMEVVGFGYDSRHIERSLREVLDLPDGRFESDILTYDDGSPSDGLAHRIATATDRESAVAEVKASIEQAHSSLGGHFRNHLQRKFERPEFRDRLQCWFPDDDLRIDYSRTGDGQDWQAITQGSQGQRSAALLAFLLAFGDEPLILDQPEDDLDNHLIYALIVRQIRENKKRRQLIIVTHNPNVVVNGDAEMVHAFDYRSGECGVVERGALQEKPVRVEVCRVMEGGHEAFSRRWARLGREF